MAIGASQQRTENVVQRRKLVVETLNLLTVPMNPRTLALVIHAWKGEKIDARAVTTLCRRDRRMWRPATDKQQDWLVPALHHEFADPIHPLVTVSTRQLPRRIVTPHSPRADCATVVLTLIAAGNRAAHHGEDTGPRLWTLAGRFASGIPGAVRYTGSAASRDTLRAAAAADFNRFAEIAAGERATAAQRFSAAYDMTDLIWGRTPDTDNGRS